MTTFSKVVLSGSTDGRAIKLTATATPGTVIHTADASALEEIYLLAVNSASTPKNVTVEFGGVSSPDDLIEVQVPAGGGLFSILPGLILTNSLVVRSFAETTNVVMIHGYVNRIA